MVIEEINIRIEIARNTFSVHSSMFRNRSLCLQTILGLMEKNINKNNISYLKQEIIKNEVTFK